MSKVTNQIDTLKFWHNASPKVKEETLKEFRTLTLLTPAMANAKTAKNEGKGYASYILHLAPSNLSGFNVCAAASQGCKAVCLNSAGRGRFENTQKARIRKTLLFVKAREFFLDKLFKEVKALERKAVAKGLTPVVRLNGTSDLPWENLRIDGKNIFETFPDVQFYDYTKVFSRLQVLKLLNLKNYHVTFSRSESNHDQALEAFKMGFNIAVVFKSVPNMWESMPTYTGDYDDLRFLDPKGVVVALIPKGKAKRDVSGFVVT